MKDLEKKEKHKQTKTYQKSRFKTLHPKAWKVFSEYVRRKDADESGRVQCFTCENTTHYKEANAGHYFHGKLDFDERNVRVQCVGCNLYRSGNLAYYGVKLARMIGTDGMEQLRLDANTIRYTCEDLEMFIQIYSSKLKELNENNP